MTSNRPYLIRALYEWLVDNDLTPFLLVDARLPQVMVPQDYVEDGRIILNVNPRAISNLELGNDWIRFSARFQGVLEDVAVPPAAVLGIYAKENGKGMLFATEESQGGDRPEDDPEPPKPGGRPALKVVK